ncbi:saccharopine dehydrogenase [Streptomyces sp. WAC05374]|uniref:saccharopine dehydrogenase C-terminal domain-containing protein n=1 Tax=Streptomyces sp. WAC05374 TaxID=2487420 RepID=UPI000F89D0A0|nr:saccharopine dehydrogenase C-terminal domain-containing protein [Streptomyces sp. WAC05374]RST19067.1 saccharopine dehydrogenase [Streptomyces sp. WAC05374]TDF36965.1 saccharopine dehydrogenase [Streptomyces sp. WAC05374]TDF46460.1 saccharopine dehydrogenase [Streptomyces sp. WAC05374]TDF47561.1 saccharopine dehydrogenase [Streptomyces sp. WAC05374]
MTTTPPVPASGTVHWIGTGLSTGRSGLALLCDRAARVVLWDRTADRAAARLAAHGLTGRAEVRALEPEALEREVGAGDVVVSMLPAAEHPRLLRLAIAARAHFACTSYVSDELREEAARAAGAGLVVLTEAGLDPGIDHLMAHQLVERAREEIGDTAASVTFTSYCGGVPAVPNDFRYRFSWAPYGVLAALGSPARYIDGGAERTAPRPWEATRELVLAGETFEVYPNRDSVPFAAQYGIPAGWHLDTFVRGTLRNAGWRAAWSEVFATVRTGDEHQLRALAKELAQRYPTNETDRDRVVLSVALQVSGAGGGRDWRGALLLDLTGDEAESAMALCVSLPLAYGVTRLLDGGLPAGLNRAAESPAEAGRWLASLEDHGVRTAFVDTLPTEPGAPR